MEGQVNTHLKLQWLLGCIADRDFLYYNKMLESIVHLWSPCQWELAGNNVHLEKITSPPPPKKIERQRMVKNDTFDIACQ